MQRAPTANDGQAAARLREAGFSLTEVMVSSLIVLIVSAALYSGLAQTQVFWESYSGDMDMRQRTRVAIDQITDELRMVGYDLGNVTEAVTRAEDYAIQFVADIDAGAETGPCDAAVEGSEYGGAERLTYALDAPNRTLMRTVDCWNGTAWVVGTAATAVLTDFDVANPIFRYFDMTGTQIPLGGGTLDLDARSDVRSVSVVFDLVDVDDLQYIGDGNTDLRLETQVRLHNLEGGLIPDEEAGG